MKRFALAWLGLVVAVPALAQGDEPSVDPKKDDRAAVKAAFESSAKAGGFTFQGRLENDSGLFRIAGLGGDEDKGEDDDGANPGMEAIPGMEVIKRMRFSNTYSFTILKYDPSLKAEFPADVRKYFKE